MPIQPEPEDSQSSVAAGGVAHQIILDFINALKENEGFEEVAGHLRLAIFDQKASELAIRLALFGEDEL